MEIQNSCSILNGSKDCVQRFVHSNFNITFRARMLDVLNIVHDEWEKSKWQTTKNIKKKMQNKYLFKKLIFYETINLTPKGKEWCQSKQFFWCFLLCRVLFRPLPGNLDNVIQTNTLAQVGISFWALFFLVKIILLLMGRLLLL